jgi:hypothetical protein
MWAPLVLLVAGYAALALYRLVVLEDEFLVSDVRGYWVNSLDRRQLFDSVHVAGYPLAVALLRSVSIVDLPAVLPMMLLNLLGLVVGAAAVYRLAQLSEVDDRAAAFAAVLFGLWPFVGLVFAVHAIADLPAMALLLTGLLVLQQGRERTAALLFGVALVTHKAMWVFVPLVAVAHLRHRRRAWRDVSPAPILLLPLLSLWVAGTLHHGSPAWIVTASLRANLEPRSALPVLDGIVGAVAAGGWKGMVKGGTIAILAVAAAGHAVAGWRRQRYAWALAAGCALLFIGLNRDTIWAAVRFSRLLVLPLAVHLAWIGERCLSARACRWLVGLVVLLLFVSQLAFATYMARLG